MTPAPKPGVFRVGDRVRVSGFGNVPKNGWAVNVDGAKAVIEQIGDPCLVVMWEGTRLEVFPSQCKKFRKQREARRK